MKTMKLGKTGIDISRMGLGTWSIGGGSAWGGDHDLQVVVDTIREAPKLGVNLIDTAPGYNFGNSEKIIGKALEEMNREDVVIITKCGVTWDQEMKGDLFNKVNGIQLYKNLNSESVKREIEGSLERMGTDYVDVYMTHWQSIPGSEYYVPIQKTMDVLNDLKAQGKIRAIGAANVDINQIQEYLKHGDLDIVQVKYSILDRGIEDEIIPCCRENGVTIQAYSPLEMGLLSGTFPRDYKPVGAQIPKKWFQPENMQAAMDVMDQWKPLCEKYNCTIANLALAWILAQGDFINLLSGSTTVGQIAENVKSAEIELDPSDVADMRAMVEAIDK
ncbi:MAG: aldo/keto reductase [Ruminococcus sp.]